MLVPPIQIFRELHRGCAHRTRVKKRKVCDGEKPMDIDVIFLVNLWKEQKGRCAISNLVMGWGYNQEWAVSVDRIDNSKGYIPENIRLVCQEFQHTSPWTSAHFLQAMTLSQVEGNVELPLTRSMKCPVFSRIKIAMSHVRDHSERLIKRLGPEGAPEVSYQDLIKQYKVQKGRCAYSNIPLTAIPQDKFWIMSLERIDNNKPYRADNIIWICVAFQTAKQWSAKKFNLVFREY